MSAMLKHLTSQILRRLTSLIGEPATQPPAAVLRAFHRGASLVVISIPHQEVPK